MVFEYALRILGPAQAETAGTYQHPAFQASLRCSCVLAEEGAAEKHLPVVEQDGLHVTVKVGNIFHPMGQEHSIGWVCLVTKAGCVMRVPLTPDCEPVASFTLEEGDAPAAAYAYCNLHGLWKKSI